VSLLGATGKTAAADLVPSARWVSPAVGLQPVSKMLAPAIIESDWIIIVFTQ
jgi:hypothetical protein